MPVNDMTLHASNLDKLRMGSLLVSGLLAGYSVSLSLSTAAVLEELDAEKNKLRLWREVCSKAYLFSNVSSLALAGLVYGIYRKTGD